MKWGGAFPGATQPLNMKFPTEAVVSGKFVARLIPQAIRQPLEQVARERCCQTGRYVPGHPLVKAEVVSLTQPDNLFALLVAVAVVAEQPLLHLPAPDFLWLLVQEARQLPAA